MKFVPLDRPLRQGQDDGPAQTEVRGDAHFAAVSVTLEL